MSLAQGGELLYQSRNLCSQTYARVQIHFPRLVLFVFFFSSISDYFITNDLTFFIFYFFFLRVKHLLYGGTSLVCNVLLRFQKFILETY